jgi:hypothetical protein
MSSRLSPARAPAQRALAGLIACAGVVWGTHQAAIHPLLPVAALCAWGLWLGVAWRWPHSWLFVLPAALPLASLAPWTGWVVRDEFDLLVLGALVAGYARLAWHGGPGSRGNTRGNGGAGVLSVWLGAACWGVVTLGLWRAWQHAGQAPASAPSAYTEFGNSLRVAKGWIYALLAWPLLRQVLQQAPQAALRRLAQGVWAGVLVCSVGVLWERSAFPGLLNFAGDYRTVAMFWEMHVGGAAIDAYLALTTPFAVGAVVAARGPRRWLVAALVLQLWAYVCLTTFARGVYGAVLGGLVVAGVLWWRNVRTPGAEAPRWRRRANVALGLVLVAQVLVMSNASSFMVDRLRASDNDFGSRLAHWSRGLSIPQGVVEQALGIGWGRLPQRYAALGREGEFPGAAQVLQDPQSTAHGSFLRLQGPPTRLQLIGRYAMAQQVPAVEGAQYRIALDVRSERATFLRVRVCERHLLYELDCQQRLVVRRLGTGGQWQSMAFALRGPGLSPGPVWAPRLVSVELSVIAPGAVVDVDNVELFAGDRVVRVRNGDFERGVAHWYPAIDAYFLPWHIDNLYLELLIERGWLGLLVAGSWLGWALWRVSFGAARHQPLAPFLAAALASGCALGLVSSVMDMPRVAFLFLWLAGWALFLPARRPVPRL